MRALKLPVVIGAAAVALLMLAGGGARQTEASETTVTLYWPAAPNYMNVAANDETPQFFTSVAMPCTDCYITAVTPELEGFNTSTQTWGVSSYTSTPPARLHHMVLFSHPTVDATCAGDSLFSQLGDRWFASGDERGTLAFPAGYGYYQAGGPGAYWATQIMVHNFSSQTQKYRLRMEFKYHPASDNLKAMRHLWMDVNNCSTSTYETPQGYFDYHWDWTVGSAASTADDVEGKVLMMGGHVHDLGVSVGATKGTASGSPTICASQGGYATGSTWNPPTISSPNAPAAAHPGDNIDVAGDPDYQGHIESMSGCTPYMLVAVGDTVRLHSQYNATSGVCDGTPGDNPGVPPNGPGVSGCIDDVMGIMGTWIYDNCPAVTNPGQDDILDDGWPADGIGDDFGDACDADADGDGVCNAGVQGPGGTSCTGTDDDDDGDGYDDAVESGSPLCGNGLDDDVNVHQTYPGPQVADDGVADDGCPGGPAQQGVFSEAQFKIGTSSLARCSAGSAVNPSPSWPSDYVSGGTPESTDTVNILDLTSLLAPTRRLDTSPGNPAYLSRYDLQPGKGTFLDWINITDLTAMFAGTSGFPWMFGNTKAFAGPLCTGS